MMMLIMRAEITVALSMRNAQCTRRQGLLFYPHSLPSGRSMRPVKKWGRGC